MKSLLKLLKENARLSAKELSSMLGVSEQEVSDKIAEYEHDGVIVGYSAIVNEDLTDSNFVSALIEVKVTPKADFGFDDIAKTIMMYDEVENLTLMSGAFDLAVTVSGTDYKEIALFVANRLSTIDGVLSTATHFALKKYKDKGIFIEEEATDERSFISP